MRNTQLARIWFKYKQTWLQVNFSFRNCFRLQIPKYIIFRTITVSQCQKIRYAPTLSWNQGNHIMGHLWNKTDHNLDHEYPDYGQAVTINMYDQSMINPESCSIYYDRIWSACFCMEWNLVWLRWVIVSPFHIFCFWFFLCVCLHEPKKSPKCSSLLLKTCFCQNANYETMKVQHRLHFRPRNVRIFCAESIDRENFSS